MKMSVKDIKNYFKVAQGYRVYLWSLFLCLFFLLVFLPASHSLNNAGRVLKVKNKVYMVRNKEKKAAKPQMLILQQDAIETAAKSRTKLRFRDGSILNLGESSKVVVREYLTRPGKKRSRSIYGLVDGYLKVVVGRSDLKIHSPTAVVAARGTEFILWVEGGGAAQSTGIIMLEGETEVKNINELVSGILVIRAGQMTRVFKNKPPEKPRPVDMKLRKSLDLKIGELLTSGPKSKIDGKVINKSDVNTSTGVAVGEGSESNVGSIVVK